MDVLEILSQGLREHSLQRSAVTLGDRSRYVGMSDIGKAVDCLRSAVAGKLQPSAAPVSLERELRLHRGHWFEAGVAEAFHCAGQPYLYQVEIHAEHQGVPIRAHPDFVFVTPNHIHIVELKSCGQLPETAYSSHEAQLFGQLGLLDSCRDTPCFSLHGGEAMSFPALVQKELNLSLAPKEKTSISGMILHVSMNGAKAFGPYAPNDIMRQVCLNLAQDIWRGMERIRAGKAALNDVGTAAGWHPLCEYCEWNADCPRFTGVCAPDMEEELLDLQDLKVEKEILCRRIRDMEKKLKKTFQGVSADADWVTAVTQRFRVGSCEGRKTLDKDRLLSALAVHLPAELAASVVSAGYKTGQPSERLFINPIH
jgi:hypothetical protein